MKESEFQNWNRLCDGEGCILEVDLEYHKNLHDTHNEYPLAPERLRINKVDKLIPNLNNKVKYVLHHKSLKQYLDLGLKLTKIHRGVKFNERAWLKDYIQLNTNLRTKGTTDFEKDFFKFMNNNVFGKTMENIRNRIDVRLVTEEIYYYYILLYLLNIIYYCNCNSKVSAIFFDPGRYSTTVKL